MGGILKGGLMKIAYPQRSTAVLLLLVVASSAVSQGERGHRDATAPSESPRFGDTPLIHAWVKEYHCPESASRLAPLRVWPSKKDFSGAEACAVAWRAHYAWMNADSLYGTRIDPRDSVPITGIVVSHSHVLQIVGDAREHRTKLNAGFSVTFYRGSTTAVIVAFSRNRDAGAIGPGHPGELGTSTGKPMQP